MARPLVTRTLTLLGIALLLGSGCSKKTVTGPAGEDVSSLLTSATVGDVQGEFRAGSIHVGSGVAPSIVASDTFVTGGSVVMSVQVPDTAVALLVGAQDRAGYYRIPIAPAMIHSLSARARKAAQDQWLRTGVPAAAQSARPELLLVLSPGRTETVLPLVLVVEYAHSASRSESRTLTASHRAAPSDLLQVSLTWTARRTGVDADVDLHVEVPVFADSSRDVYFGNRLDLGAALDLDSNAGCVIDGIRSENITWSATPPPTGRYTVRADLFSNCGAGQNDTLDFVVTVRQCGVAREHRGTFVLAADSARGGTARSGRPIESFDFAPCPTPFASLRRQ